MMTHFNTNGDELRQYCIRWDFYTMGTNEEYSKLFDQLYSIERLHDFKQMVDKLEEIASDILDHSPVDVWPLPDEESKDTNVTSIMTDLMDLQVISIWF